MSRITKNAAFCILGCLIVAFVVAKVLHWLGVVTLWRTALLGIYLPALIVGIILALALAVNRNTTKRQQ
jgi:hypothetical protein